MLKEFRKNVGKYIFILFVVAGAYIVLFCLFTLSLLGFKLLKVVFEFVADNQQYMPIVFGFILIVLYLYDRFRKNKTK